MQGDAEFNLAHFALQKLKILPSQLENMSQKEKAFIYASIQVRVDTEKREMEKAKVKKGR